MAYRHEVLLLLIGLFTGFSFTRGASQSGDTIQGKNYGQTCGEDSDCNLSQGLRCLDNECACPADKYWVATECLPMCFGTRFGMNLQEDSEVQYQSYKRRYENCTYVKGNLELAFLTQAEDIDLSFLSKIQEVTGYVLIVNVFARYVPLTNLRIIRGSQLYKYDNEEYSLFVSQNSPRNTTRVGLRELRFKSLKEIMRGKVFFNNNNMLCYARTIHWEDINLITHPPVEFVSSDQNYRRPCGVCHESCFQPTTGLRHCWGEGPNMCQSLSSGDVCNPSCDSRCFGALSNECCHKECAAGCNGPKRTDCLACKRFYNDGECVQNCPPLRIYDSSQLALVPNKNARFAYGTLCVKECPEHMLQDEGACVRSCPKGKISKHGKCDDCEGPCPKTCEGVKDFIHKNNIGQFARCTIIDGNLRILESTFEGDPHNQIPSMNASDLKVLNTIQEINGYITINSRDPSFSNLSVLSNLRIIHGRQVDLSGNSLSILGTQLTSLDLPSLMSIKNGFITVVANTKLCYVASVNFKNLVESPNQVPAKVFHNANHSDCVTRGKVCSSLCSQDGCWGHGPKMCLSCAYFQLTQEGSKECVRSCMDTPNYYDAGNSTCKKCDIQCANSCTGPGSVDCDSCKNVLVRGNNKHSCMEECPNNPILMYPDDDRVCQICHEYCTEGCSGPSEKVGWGGCKSCDLGIRHNENGEENIFCMAPEVTACPDGYYQTYVKHNPNGDTDDTLYDGKICEPCHELCETCDGLGPSNCLECRYFSQYDICVKACKELTYPNTTTGVCSPCDSECRTGCQGPTSADCDACKSFKNYLDDKQFKCVNDCPDDHSHLVEDRNNEELGHIVCASDDHPEVMAREAKNAEEEKKKMMTIVIPTVAGVIILGVLLAVFAHMCWKRARSKENTAKLTSRMFGYDEDEPLTPTDAKPDLAQLRLIKESELRRGGIIGSGAFGTVYKGFWIPDGENVKIPVAIKVLQEGTSPNQNKELLEEARVMCSVENPCCIRILAVCMTAQMMLITQLMPLGCLLDYVRKHKDNIGSKVLLNWCTQISRGMAYLEERGIVHRDLAARNVLVQSPSQVKITDFGLAKLLDFNEDEYHAAGGKMPIKWLALECIQHRIFTHKSDVWSYGVTVWELFTYGQRPYENTRARDVPDLLEKGERLPQPAICTIDVYMIMIKCWMLDADSRPEFKELTDEFAKMARDPGRYLVIQGDRLMRLPSHSYDKNDLVRSLSVAADGPEEVIEAEDYLMPRTTRLPSVENNNTATVKTPLLQNYDTAARPDPKDKESLPMTNVPRREKRYAHLESAAKARQQRENSPTRERGDSVNSRYSSDPIASLFNRDEIDGTVSPVSRNSSSNKSDKMLRPADVMIHLPVDEDDYLQPKSSHPRPYMDLIDGKDYYLNEKPSSEGIEADGPQYMPHDPAPVLMVENPEYFDKVDKPALENHSALNNLRKKPTDYYNDLTARGVHPEVRPLILQDIVNSETTV